ncbi:hypothetical protein [Paenibacillus sp. G2S3]|uniref:beta-xylosidase family glycoside hydrolase n=1 Tax=Paenibacillus sp. G2S3 TaxID=3047872 RepID=UPI0032E50F25
MAHLCTRPIQGTANMNPLGRETAIQYDEISSMQLSVKHWERYYLKVEIHGRELVFYASPDGVNWTVVCTPLDFGTLSDEYGGKLGFTGS